MDPVISTTDEEVLDTTEAPPSTPPITSSTTPDLASVPTIRDT